MKYDRFGDRRGGVGLLVDGLRKERVILVLELAVRRFNAFSKMQAELDEARTALSDCKIIDRANSILMNQRSLAEQDACCGRAR